MSSHIDNEINEIPFTESLRASVLHDWMLGRLSSSGVVQFKRTELEGVVADCFLAHTKEGDFLCYFYELKKGLVQGVTSCRYLSASLHIEAGDAQETWLNFRGPEDTSFSIHYAGLLKDEMVASARAYWERVRELRGIQYDLFYHVSNKPARLRLIK